VVEEGVLYGGSETEESAAPGEPCRICENTEGNREFVAKEMMLGTGDRFPYQECGRCGVLQIRKIPEDLSPYYAPPYYSFSAPYRTPPLRRWVKRRIARHRLGRTDPVGALLSRARRLREVEWARTAGVGLDGAILDVGAGSGQILLALHDCGFRDLLGVDPYLDADRRYEPGIRVLRAGIEDVRGPFDLVMFHHSFEHVADPAGTLAAARDRLAPGGCILIRMPVAGASWRTYGSDWVELDAPRHLHVHTPGSLALLAGRLGLAVETVHYDSDAFEIWGSEQYRRGIALADPRSHSYGGRGEVFSRTELEEFENRVQAMNRAGTAGRAAFWLRGTR
jgi:SAM-dependent methyltransferase